ncbi:MAG: hypothetical protein ABIL05_04810 [candidate division WOR-3 bacterium]
MYAKKKTRLYGRSMSEAPEIDGRIYVSGEQLQIGKFYKVRITAFKNYDLYAQPLEEAGC